MTSEIYSVICGGPGPVLPNQEPYTRLDNQSNEYSPCHLYQSALAVCRSDVIIYLHDDLTIHDPEWQTKIMELFLERELCVAVGLGGATGLGNQDLYREPFNIRNLARTGYGDNQDDAEVHGTRITGPRRIAVPEQYCMAIRTDWLKLIGGWPARGLTHHCLDYYIGCQAALDEREMWQTGSASKHAGGATSTLPIYKDAKWLMGGSLESDHQLAHLFIYNNFRDVLPLCNDYTS